jgi:hypothetical protein
MILFQQMTRWESVERQKFILLTDIRFHHIYKFLDIPFQDIAVLAPSKL